MRTLLFFLLLTTGHSLHAQLGLELKAGLNLADFTIPEEISRQADKLPGTTFNLNVIIPLQKEEVEGDNQQFALFGGLSYSAYQVGLETTDETVTTLEIPVGMQFTSRGSHYFRFRLGGWIQSRLDGILGYDTDLGGLFAAGIGKNFTRGYLALEYEHRTGMANFLETDVKISEVHTVSLIYGVLF